MSAHNWGPEGEKYADSVASGTALDVANLNPTFGTLSANNIDVANGGRVRGAIIQPTGATIPNALSGKPYMSQDGIFNTSIYRVAGYADYTQRQRVRVFEDFLADAGATLPVPWGKQDTSAAGSPTLDYVADALNGEYTLTHDAQSEAQNLTLYWADQLMIDPTKKPILEVRLKINFAGANFSADQRIVIGLATARNATLDSVAQHAWFRIEGANLNILKEADDGTTDTDDVDTTIDIVDNTYTTFRIDLSSTSAIGMYVDNVAAGGAALAAAALAATHKMQPFIEIQRDAGTEAEAVTIDYVMVEQDRI